jgi:hypothetical protein
MPRQWRRPPVDRRPALLRRVGRDTPQRPVNNRPDLWRTGCAWWLARVTFSPAEVPCRSCLLTANGACLGPASSLVPPALPPCQSLRTGPGAQPVDNLVDST